MQIYWHPTRLISQILKLTEASVLRSLYVLFVSPEADSSVNREGGARSHAHSACVREFLFFWNDRSAGSSS